MMHLSTNFDRRTKQIGYLTITILVGLVLVVEDLIQDEYQPGWILLEFVLFVPVLWGIFLLLGPLFNRHLMRWRRVNYLRSWENRELLFASCWGLIISLGLTAICLWVGQLFAFEYDDQSFFDNSWLVWVANLILVAVVVVIEVLGDLLEKRKSLEMMNERLLKNQEIAKYQALVNQISPHFLFNSLNVLSYLVYQNPREAEQFIEKLSEIYRYILQLSGSHLVPLKQEMEFIESYIFLQKIRYRENLVFNWNLKLHTLQQLVPPLTLQVLVENAIKHNIISPEQPLRIRISSTGDFLLVENNLQQRIENKMGSTQIGLKNLQEKYAILDGRRPEFSAKDGTFIAKVPLLNQEL